MKLGACTWLFSDLALDDTLDLLSGMGIEGAEINCNGEHGKPAHIDPDSVLNDEKGARDYLAKFERRGMHITALNCSGNAVHPDEAAAKIAADCFERTVLMAERLGVPTVITFSGTPGGSPGDRTPNWVTCPWPDEYLSILKYQWDDVLVPYWERAVKFARDHGVTRIALEMHPGFCVYNLDTLFRLRGAVGDEIGANFDPSHLMWNGVDPAAAILKLEDALFGMHAKDVYVNEDYISLNGCNDNKHYGNVKERAWTFRTVGWGHSPELWKRMISALATIGFDGTIDIEHEDLFMSRKEGLQRAVEFLKPILIRERPEGMWWA
ncbi:MAG: sugar phosphate isomerase/epimerase [Synergistaceae bacterium]|jgi:sugar phosphate isomerase/epimerase|nr:sugar phosphate isomerase/epimerase [Synergistaceae bacterium]